MFEWGAGNVVCMDFLDKSGLRKRKFFDDNYNFQLYWANENILGDSPFQYYLGKELLIL